MPLLEKIRYFTKGCNDLLIVIDHQSLIKLLGVRRFDEINNPRHFLSSSATYVEFETEYQLDMENHFADEFARIAMLSKADHFEENMVAMIGNEVHLFFTITWKRV